MLLILMLVVLLRDYSFSRKTGSAKGNLRSSFSSVRLCYARHLFLYAIFVVYLSSVQYRPFPNVWNCEYWQKQDLNVTVHKTHNTYDWVTCGFWNSFFSILLFLFPFRQSLLPWCSFWYDGNNVRAFLLLWPIVIYRHIGTKCIHFKQLYSCTTQCSE